jgi:hypothetical protein
MRHFFLKEGEKMSHLKRLIKIWRHKIKIHNEILDSIFSQAIRDYLLTQQLRRKRYPHC